MSTNNAVNTSLSQQTGTGKFVGDTSPTLVTPSLGVATATSVNFGGNALSVYAENQSWTPVVTFATPGDLSVAYTTQGGVYTDIGRVRILAFSLVFTPTYTTASGSFEITGIGITGNGNYTAPLVIASAFTWTAGRTQLILECPATNYLVINQFGTGAGAALISTTNFTSGLAVTISGSITVLH